MSLAFRSRIVLLAFAIVAAAGWFMTTMGREAPRIVYEADVPEWRWTGRSFSDQYLALLVDDGDLRRARPALPDHVWNQVGAKLEEWIADDDTAVIVAYLGEAPTGGHAIRVRRVEVDEKNGAGGDGDGPMVTVTIARRRPTPDEFVTQVITFPFEVIPLDRELLPQEPFTVRFVDDEGDPLNDEGAAATLRPIIRRPRQ